MRKAPCFRPQSCPPTRNESGPQFPLDAWEQTAGKLPQVRGVRQPYKLPLNLSFSNPRGYEGPSKALLGWASGRTGKVFTFMDGIIPVKDGRASASERHVCMAFFFPSKHSNSQEVRYSARQTSRSAAGGMPLWAHQVPGATLSPWVLGPSSLGFGELGKGTPVSCTFPRVPAESCRHPHPPACCRCQRTCPGPVRAGPGRSTHTVG